MIFKVFTLCVLHCVTHMPIKAVVSQNSKKITDFHARSYKREKLQRKNRRQRKKFLGYNRSWKRKKQTKTRSSFNIWQELHLPKNTTIRSTGDANVLCYLSITFFPPSIYCFAIHCSHTLFGDDFEWLLYKEKQKGVFLSEITWLHHFLLFVFEISSKACGLTSMSFCNTVCPNQWACCPFSSYTINSKSFCWVLRQHCSCSISRLPTSVCLRTSGGHLLQYEK